MVRQKYEGRSWAILPIVYKSGIDIGYFTGVLKDTIAFARVVVVGVAFDGEYFVAGDFGDDAGLAHATAVTGDENGAGFDEMLRHKLQTCASERSRWDAMAL